MQHCEEDTFVQKQRPFTRRKPGTDSTSLTECQLSPVRRGEDCSHENAVLHCEPTHASSQLIAAEQLSRYVFYFYTDVCSLAILQSAECVPETPDWEVLRWAYFEWARRLTCEKSGERTRRWKWYPNKVTIV